MANTVRDSRVTVPQLPPRPIWHPRLLARLDQAVARPLTLRSAGPGTGKTVLLTDWVRHTQARVAWVNTTTADAEPRRVWRTPPQARVAWGHPDTTRRGAAGVLAPARVLATSRRRCRARPAGRYSAG